MKKLLIILALAAATYGASLAITSVSGTPNAKACPTAPCNI